MTRAAVVTVSDSAVSGEREHDESGDLVTSMLADSGFEPVERVLVADDRAAIAARLRTLVSAGTPLIVTTGGTGFSPRDVTPEATDDVIEREAAGLAELMRSEGLKQTPFAALSRGVAGTSGRSLILNLPGSPQGARDGIAAVIGVLPHALKLLAGQAAHHD